MIVREFLHSDEFFQGIIVESFGVLIELTIILAIIPVLLYIKNRNMRKAFLPLSSMIVTKNIEDIIYAVMKGLGASRTSYMSAQMGAHRIYAYLHKDFDELIDHTEQQSGSAVIIPEAEWNELVIVLDQKISSLNETNLVVDPMAKWPYHLTNLMATWIGVKATMNSHSQKGMVCVDKNSLMVLIFCLKAQFEELKKPLDIMDAIHRHGLSNCSAIQRWVKLRCLKKMGLLDMFKMR